MQFTNLNAKDATTYCSLKMLTSKQCSVLSCAEGKKRKEKKKRLKYMDMERDAAMVQFH